MKEINDTIKKVLQSKMQRIDDDYFTKKVVEIHLIKNRAVKSKPFVNFKSLIIGLSSVFINVGLILLIRQNSEWITEIGLTEKHGFILISLSIIFLIYKWIEEYSTPKMVVKQQH